MVARHNIDLGHGRIRGAGAADAALVVLFTFWLLAACGALAEVGVGESPLWTVDTRWKDFEGAGFSGYFVVDTRFSGSAGAGSSGLFVVDTRGATSGTAIIAGRVTDSMGTGLGGVTVSALQSSVVRAQSGTDPAGYYSLSSLPAASYDLRAQKPNFLTGTAYGIGVGNGETASRNFTLAAAPPAPVVVPTTRPPEPPNLVPIAGTQLKVYSNGVFESNGSIDPTKPTVVMTHGWNSNPEVWATNMAAKMIAGGVGAANLLAWDWRGRAGTGAELGLALSRTPNEGDKLGQALAAVLSGQGSTPVHFIGHSFGTLVNARAADHLLNSATPAFGAGRIQMTLMDDAGAANVGGRLITLSYTIPLSQNIFTAGFASQRLADVFAVGWIDPIPDASAWMDNYISLVGMWHGQAVNVSLRLKSIPHSASINPAAWVTDAHAYACAWYARTAENPNGCILGNRYSFERLGAGTQFPSPSPYAPGSLYKPVPVFGDDFTLVPAEDLDTYIAQEAAELAASGLLKAANALAQVGQKIGDTVVDVFENTIPDGLVTVGSVLSIPIYSLRVSLSSAIGGPLRPVSSGGDPTAGPAVWLPIAVPTNATLFAFDFRLTGNGNEDMLSASIGGTNVFLLEAKYMPTNQTLNSGPIDVSRWSGQTVEFFFGLLGGTSTNANVIVEAMRFYQVDPPLVTAETVGPSIVVSWPATATGFALESSKSLAGPTWTALTNSPTISGMRQYVTNSMTDASRFYRLKRD